MPNVRLKSMSFYDKGAISASSAGNMKTHQDCLSARGCMAGSEDSPIRLADWQTGRLADWLLGCVSVSLNDIFENLSGPKDIFAGDIFGPESVSVKIYYG